MILNETYTLENGMSIPKLGLGTWFIDDDQAAEAVRTAVKLGYRLIDTAQAYGNERGVGEGVRTCGVPREELFVASKVAAELKTYDEAKKSIDETLEKMGLDYLDQMIIHSPSRGTSFAWKSAILKKIKPSGARSRMRKARARSESSACRTFCATTLKICSLTAA